jgi:type IV pilus assembly protein PilA
MFISADSKEQRMKKLTKKGFTLIELMIVVAIVGILAVLAVFGVRKYITNAKTAEARNSVGAIAKNASHSYEKEFGSTAILAAGTSATSARLLCGSATLTPGAAPTGVKYQSSAANWTQGTQTSGWQCLKFTMTEPQYYAYNYTSDMTTNFSALAHGNLDGNATTSQFSLSGAVEQNFVKIAPNIAELNPDE